MKTKTIKQATLYAALAAMLLGQSVPASVTFVGQDSTTGGAWRTPSVTKSNDIDGDNIYGSEGYYLPAGLRSDGSGNGPLNPFLTVTNVITGNRWEINTLPGYILDLEYTDPLERGQSWGGAFGLQSEGVLDLVPGGFTGEAGAGILPGDLTTNTLYLTLQRTNSPNFRLTFIFGNQPNPAGYHGDPMGPDDGTGMNVTLDDGSGAVGPEASGDYSVDYTNVEGYVTYQSWDISAGSSDISITISPVDFGIPRLSGLAIDSLPVAAPAILVQPIGVTNFTGLPVSLSVTAVGSGLSYQWQQNSNNLPGQTSWALALVNTTTNNSGTYQVIVSNSVTNITSAPVAVAVVPLPVVTLYQDLFTGTGPVNGRIPDTAGTAPWVAGSDWNTDGQEAVATLQSDNDANSQEAFLPFIPIAGRIQNS